MNKCDTCAFSYSCALKDTNLAPDCGYYAEEDDNMKRIKQLIKITDELLKEFEVDSKNNQSVRCSDCYAEHRKQRVRENVQRLREKQKM